MVGILLIFADCFSKRFDFSFNLFQCFRFRYMLPMICTKVMLQVLITSQLLHVVSCASMCYKVLAFFLYRSPRSNAVVMFVGHQKTSNNVMTPDMIVLFVFLYGQRPMTCTISKIRHCGNTALLAIFF